MISVKNVACVYFMCLGSLSGYSEVNAGKVLGIGAWMADPDADWVCIVLHARNFNMNFLNIK